MKNESSSNAGRSQSVQGLHTGLLRKSLITVLVASALSSCTVMKNPESFKLDIPGNTGDFKNRLYTGAAMGNSQLSPNTRGEGFSVDSSGDMGTQLRLGYDVHNMLAVEVDTSVLGASTLRANNAGVTSAVDVQYSAAAVSALVYGWSGVQMRSRREGLSAYGRLGFAALKKSSNVIELEESGTLPIIGAGVEYGFNNGLGIRAEVTRFDSDATFLGFGAVYRFGISPSGIGRMIADAAEPALASKSTKVVQAGELDERATVVERYAGPGARGAKGGPPHLHYTSGAEPNEKYVGSMSDRWRPAMRADDRDSDGVLDNIDSCPDTNTHVTVDRYGCGLFDAVLHDVTFKSGSRWLTPRARGQLDLLAETLLAFPESRVQVRAHTDSQGAADMNLGLSSRRAEIVVQYLQSRGVHELQMQAVGMGEAQPLDSNATREGRRKNRRVDIVTLPDQDAGQLLIASHDQSNPVLMMRGTHEDRIGTPVAHVPESAWNSRAKRAKNAAPTPKAKASKPPELLAAKPDDAELLAKTETVVTEEAPKLATNETTTEPSLMAAKPETKAPKSDYSLYGAAPILTALPQPGRNPNFPITGVLIGVGFAPGVSALSDNVGVALQPLVDALKRNPSVRLAIMAHTDDSGDVDHNKTLSKSRADAVVNHLIKSGVDGDRLEAEGYGEMLPLVQNVTEADRRRNRRVEVRVLPPKP